VEEEAVLVNPSLFVGVVCVVGVDGMDDAELDTDAAVQ
jgi:hypothetical protein